MPERQSAHPDNGLIDRMQEESLGETAQQSRSGGEVNRRVGTRAEQNRAEGTLGGDKVETAVGSDNPEQDAMKGEKTLDKLQQDRNES